MNGATHLDTAEGRICAVNGPGGMVGHLYGAASVDWPSPTGWDAESNRVAKGTITNWSAGCDTTHNGFNPTKSYVLGPSNEELTETDGNGNWQRSNVYAAGTLIATYDMPTGATPALHFHLADWLGTRRVQTDINGCPEEAFTSLPFGDSLTPVPLGPCATNTADDATNHHFTGKERDTESGNDYFGARYYSSAMGRFMSPDWSARYEPIPYAKLDDPQSLNLYAYVRNSPLSRADLDGHIDCSGNKAGEAGCVFLRFIHQLDQATQAQQQDSSTGNTQIAENQTAHKPGSPVSAYPQGSTYCGDFVCSASGEDIGVAPGDIQGRRSDQDLGDAFNIATAVGIGSAIKTMAEDVGKVEAGRFFGTRMGGNKPLLNSNDNLRVGWSYIKSTKEYVFRVGGDWVGAIKSNPHINLWPPSWWFK